MTALSGHRNNPIIQSWRVKAGSDLLSGAATLAVEKVFLAEVTPASPKDNDIALVKLRSPVHDSGEAGKALLGAGVTSVALVVLSIGMDVPGVAASCGHRVLEQGWVPSWWLSPACEPPITSPFQTAPSPSACPILMRSWCQAHPCG